MKKIRVFTAKVMVTGVICVTLPVMVIARWVAGNDAVDDYLDKFSMLADKIVADHT